MKRFEAPGRVARAGRSIVMSEYFVLILTGMLFLIALPLTDGLATSLNLKNLLSNTWPLLIIAVGQTFVLITAGIDLSQTAIMGLVSVVGGASISTLIAAEQFGGTPIWGNLLGDGGGWLAGVPANILIAAVIMMTIGALVGVANGVAVAYLRMPPFMVTLVTLSLFTAIAIWLTKGEKIGGMPPDYATLGPRGIIADLGIINVTWAFVVAAAVVLIADTLLRRTRTGRWLYATGTNPVTAKLSGVPVERVIVFAYAVSGVCAALGGLLYSARSFVGDPTLGRDGQVLLDIIGACVIGGTSLFGGRGRVLWTVFGVMFLVLLGNILSLLGLPFYVVTIAKGSVILFAVILDTYRTRWSAQASRASAASAPVKVAVP
jgi:ribose/xylose/arabinose/galactoside ABC-type transport system permease subunit